MSLLIEIGCRIDETAKAQALAQPVEVTIAGDFHLRQKIEQCKPRHFSALFKAEMLAQTTLKTQLVAPERALDADQKIAARA